jgi:hypothetical protein
MAVRRWAWIVAAEALVLGVLVVVGLAQGWWQGGEPAARPAVPFSAATSLSARSVGFGDPLTARLDILVDPASVDRRSVDVKPHFGAYRITSTNVRSTHGAGELISYRYVLECLAPGCVPGSSRVEWRFRPAIVSYRTGTGETVTRSVAWPSYQLSSRVTAAERRSPATSLRFDPALPAPSYRISPGTLRALLTALAALLAVTAAGLAWLALRRRGPARRAGPSVSRLHQALQAVRASSANGRPAERRKALGWLGRELRTVERPAEADEARRLAWSENAPTPTAAGDFAEQVETAGGTE